MNRLLAMLAVVGLLTSCAAWPEEGRGGMAERQGGLGRSSDRAEAKRLEAARARLARAREGGADKTTPAAMRLANLDALRAQRELAGGLMPDRTLGRLETRLTEIELHLTTFTAESRPRGTRQ